MFFTYITKKGLSVLAFQYVLLVFSLPSPGIGNRRYVH